MNRKKLPRAIVLTANEMRQGTAAAAQPPDLQNPKVQSEPSANPSARPANNVIEMMPRPEAAADAVGNAIPTVVKADDALATQRRRQARSVVERHANLSAIGGAIPIPIANIASTTAIILRMVKSLSVLYGVPFERSRARAIVIGLMGGVMPTGLATAANSALIYLLPGYNLIGLAISSVTASAYARGIGHVFIEHFETGSTLVDFPSAALR